MFYINSDINQAELFRNFVSSFSQRLEGWALIRIWLQHVESYGGKRRVDEIFSFIIQHKRRRSNRIFLKNPFESKRTLDQNRVNFPVIMPKSLMLLCKKTNASRQFPDPSMTSLSNCCQLHVWRNNNFRIIFDYRFRDKMLIMKNCGL